MKSLIQEIRNEVLARSLAATVSFAVLATFIIFTGLRNVEFLNHVRVLCGLIILASLWRGTLYVQWKRMQMVSDAVWNQFAIANILNSLSWGAALVFMIHQNETSPLNIALVVLIAVGITNASILTLGNDFKVHVTFVTLTSCPLTAIFFQRYSKTHEPVELSLAFMLLVFMVYVLSQAQLHRKRFAEKIAADNALLVSQKELIEQTAMTEHANRLASLGEMAAGMAHEINNPLAVITGNVNLLQAHIQKNNLDPNLLKYAERAVSASMRITRIIKSLRTLSHRSSEEVRTKINITTILKDTLEFYGERLDSLGIRLTSEFQDHTVSCDPVQVEQILLNLLNNARDAVQDLSPEERWMKLQVSTHNATLVIAVTNGGPAIDPELRQLIFTPFFTTKPPGQGMGLGLAISRTIALRHQGELQMQLADGHTCFRLLLPLAS